VTHDQVEAMSMGDKVVIMNLGLLQQVGTPSEIYHNPGNLFVANFIGSPGMNFINCMPVKDESGKVSLKITDVDVMLQIPQDIQKIILDKKEVEKHLILGVRPEDVSMEFQHCENYIDTEVYVIETLGNYNIIDVKIGDDIVRVRTLPTVTPDIGTDCCIGFDMSRVILFDKETEDSLM
jgi:multiple sugar transport system ATP-binding protein